MHLICISSVCVRSKEVLDFHWSKSNTLFLRPEIRNGGRTPVMDWSTYGRIMTYKEIRAIEFYCNELRNFKILDIYDVLHYSTTLDHQNKNMSVVVL